jgi:hypothetical protein
VDALDVWRARPPDGDCWGLLKQSFLAAPSGLKLEFGVGDGGSLRFLAGLTGEPVFGFDSFRGLPESWNSENARGAFDRGGVPPDNLLPNARLVVGSFQDTLPTFLREHDGPVAFAHLDADLYSSTKCVLDLLADRLAPNAVLNFNEFADYPGWEDHEARAFAEWLEETGFHAECLGRTDRVYSQAAFRVWRPQ